MITVYRFVFWLHHIVRLSKCEPVTKAFCAVYGDPVVQFRLYEEVKVGTLKKSTTERLFGVGTGVFRKGVRSRSLLYSQSTSKEEESEEVRGDVCFVPLYVLPPHTSHPRVFSNGNTKGGHVLHPPTPPPPPARPAGAPFS